MRLRFLASSFFSLLLATTAGATTFDPRKGTIAFDRADQGVRLTQSFDSPTALTALAPRVFGVQRVEGYVAFSDTPETVQATAFVGDAIPLEGEGALRVPADRAIVIGDEASLAPITDGRVEARLFVRADGAMPSAFVAYGFSALDAQTLTSPTARVSFVRTGVATSDGWVELSTGPIDGAIFKAKIRGIVLLANADAPAGSSFLVDGLEVKHVADLPLSVGNCSLASEATDCAPGAACVEGLCMDSAAVYDALPPIDTRRDIVGRVSTYLTRFNEDRNGVRLALDGFAKEMPAVAETATTPMAFYRAYAQAFGNVRGAHSSPPLPNSYSRVGASSTISIRTEASELNACFGVVERDFLDKARGFAVYATVAPSVLQVGDVLDTVDGEPLASWISKVAAEHRVLAADPDSDAPYIAQYLNALLLRHARSATVLRCTAANVCTQVAVDFEVLRNEKAADAKPLRCGLRFKLAVDVPSGVDPDAYETAIAQTVDGVMTVHTNGEPYEDNSSWVSTVRGAFTSAQDRMLIDKRRGDGGGGAALDTWGEMMRRPNVGIFFASRVDHAAIDGPPDFMNGLLGKCSGTSLTAECKFFDFETHPAAPGSLPAKVAWLNVLDGSASDMATLFAKGVPNVRIFAPNRTAGLFGALNMMAPPLPGWSGGSVQYTDTREGNTPAERQAGKWLSGHGIAPDEIVVQLQSDLVAGRDTMLDRARAWLQ